MVVYVYYSFKQLRPSHNTILAFTGSLGTGKTYHAVKYAIKEYKRERIMYYLHLQDYLPVVYSNIPVKIRFKIFGIIGREQWAEQLTREHLLLKKRLPEKAILIIDEVGQFASQYDYNNPNVMNELQELIRFYRHYTDGHIFLTDQNSNNIVVPLRRRISQVYNLSDMHRVLFFFYKVSVNVVELTEDVTNVTLATETPDDRPFFFGTLPFKLKPLKWLNKLLGFKKYYDDRCYSINYTAPQEQEIAWAKYKTKEFIDLSASREQIQTERNKKKGITM
jgi:hypothetical protein